MILVVDAVLSRLPAAHKSAIVEIINQPKSSTSQKRALFLKKGLLRSTADELEVLSDTCEVSGYAFVTLPDEQ